MTLSLQKKCDNEYHRISRASCTDAVVKNALVKEGDSQVAWKISSADVSQVPELPAGCVATHDLYFCLSVTCSSATLEENSLEIFPSRNLSVSVSLEIFPFKKTTEIDPKGPGPLAGTQYQTKNRNPGRDHSWCAGNRIYRYCQYYGFFLKSAFSY